MCGNVACVSCVVVGDGREAGREGLLHDEIGEPRNDLLCCLLASHPKIKADPAHAHTQYTGRIACI